MEIGNNLSRFCNSMSTFSIIFRWWLDVSLKQMYLLNLPTDRLLLSFLVLCVQN